MSQASEIGIKYWQLKLVLGMKLYSREDCPLCEDVEENLARLKVKYTFIDIDQDETLRKKYHVRVPVLVNDQQQELAWPFDEAQLMVFIG